MCLHSPHILICPDHPASPYARERPETEQESQSQCIVMCSKFHGNNSDKDVKDEREGEAGKEH